MKMHAEAQRTLSDSGIHLARQQNLFLKGDRSCCVKNLKIAVKREVVTIPRSGQLLHQVVLCLFRCSADWCMLVMSRFRGGIRQRLHLKASQWCVQTVLFSKAPSFAADKCILLSPRDKGSDGVDPSWSNLSQHSLCNRNYHCLLKHAALPLEFNQRFFLSILLILAFIWEIFICYAGKSNNVTENKAWNHVTRICSITSLRFSSGQTAKQFFPTLKKGLGPSASSGRCLCASVRMRASMWVKMWPHGNAWYISTAALIWDKCNYHAWLSFFLLLKS